MRIAFISREFAGAADGGGIGTYVRNAAAALVARGHDVEVFTSGSGEPNRMQDGALVINVGATGDALRGAVVQPFLSRHAAKPFDVMEAAEFGADSLALSRAAPGIAKVIKLHTASYQIRQINDAYLPLSAKARFMIGALRRGQMPRPFWGRYDAASDPELEVVLAADEITAPSRAIVELTRKTWHIGEAAVIPNYYRPAPGLLAADTARRSGIVTFVGKLEVRKGVLELARAMKIVAAAVPDVRFRIVGRALPHPATGEPLDAVMRELAGTRVVARTEFTGAVPYDAIAGLIAESDVAVFPSYWENSPYVCLEAMAAGCGVIGSSSGGMAEMINHGQTGLLVRPQDHWEIARALVSLLENPARRSTMGEAARRHVLRAYSDAAIGPLQEASYRRAIENVRARQARVF